MIIPNGVNVEINTDSLKVSGPKGTTQRKLPKKVTVTIKDRDIVANALDKALVGTWNAHIKNMIKGATQGFALKLKVVNAHFPINVKVNGRDIAIENFLGEKQARKAKVVGDTKVEVKKQEIFLSGPSKEDVGNTYTSLKQATKIRNRDARVFQDGFYKE